MEINPLANALGARVRKGPIGDIKGLRTLFQMASEATPEEVEECAVFLVGAMRRGTEGSSLAAEQLLGLLGEEAFGTVARALEIKDTPWRQRILSVLWRLVRESPQSLVSRHGPDAVRSVTPLLQDCSGAENSLAEDLRDEAEYLELRVCDDAYLLLAELHGAYLEEFSFVDLGYEDRDEVIGEARKRFLLASGPSSV